MRRGAGIGIMGDATGAPTHGAGAPVSGDATAKARTGTRFCTSAPGPLTGRTYAEGAGTAPPFAGQAASHRRGADWSTNVDAEVA